MKGLQVLTEHLGEVEAERFIALIQREPFDYTTWQRNLDKDLTVHEISNRAIRAAQEKRDQQS